MVRSPRLLNVFTSMSELPVPSTYLVSLCHLRRPPHRPTTTAPPLHRSTAPPLHRPTAPPPHRSTAPPLHHLSAHLHRFIADIVADSRPDSDAKRAPWAGRTAGDVCGLGMSLGALVNRTVIAPAIVETCCRRCHAHIHKHGDRNWDVECERCQTAGGLEGWCGLIVRLHCC